MDHEKLSLYCMICEWYRVILQISSVSLIVNWQVLIWFTGCSRIWTWCSSQNWSKIWMPKGVCFEAFTWWPSFPAGTYFFFSLSALINTRHCAVANKTFISIGLKALRSRASCSYRTWKGNISNFSSFTMVIISPIEKKKQEDRICESCDGLVTGEEPMAKCWCSQWSVAQPLRSDRSKVKSRLVVLSIVENL